MLRAVVGSVLCAVLIFSLVSTVVAQTGNGPVTYLYDDAGRLVGFIDVNGNAATYTYDSVGNIVNISRFTATQVSILQFTPEQGPVGTAVTIYGTGFSTTIGQNSVTFNGAAASVTAATTTQLQVTVPSGATTGRIAVTTPNGTATSSTNFKVGPGSSAPTITSFSPSTAVSGTSITVTGTNFDLLPANDRLRVNASQAVTNSVASSTSLTGTVPGSTASGHLSLITPTGRAVSSQDLFIPFNSHVPADIGFTARLALGVVQNVSLAAGKIALLLFDSTAGQHASVQMSGSTFSSCTLYLIAPDNSTVASTGCTSGTLALPTAILPKTGTYTIGIDPGTGSGSINVSYATDIVGTISIDGPPVTVTTTAAGQDVRLDFGAAAGQRVFVTATSVSNSQAYLHLVTPSGTDQTSAVFLTNSPSGQTFSVDTQTLAIAGTYQLWVMHSSTAVGSETLQIRSVPADFTGTLSVPAAGATGPTVRVPGGGNLAIGQNASLTFSGTAGQKLSFNITSSSIGSTAGACLLTLYDPNHTRITSVNCGTGASSYLDTITLASTGNFTAYVDPQSTATGAVSLSVNNAQDVTTPAISIDGGAVTATTTVAGQDVRLSFPGTAGQRVLITATNVTNPQAILYLVNPSGTNQAQVSISNSPSGQSFVIDTQTLATSGTYQLWVSHFSSTNIGSETLTISSVPTDFTGTLTVPAAGTTGPAVRVPTTGTLAAGQNASLTFSGTAGQKLSFNITGSTIGSTTSACFLSIYSPTNTRLAFGYCGTGASAYLDTITLASTGTYTATIDPQATATGAVSLSINNDQDVTTPAISIGGGAVTATTTVAGQDARLSFTATAGQRIFTTATGVTNPSAVLYLVTPSGSNQASISISNSPGQTFTIDTQTLSSAGTYQLWVMHSSSGIGSETLQISSVPADLSASVTIGGAAYQFSTVAGQNANITFSVSQSETVSAHWTSGTYPTNLSCFMRVTGPSPSTTQVGFASCNAATGNVSLGTLSPGTYNILVDPQAQSAGGLSLTVTTP